MKHTLLTVAMTATLLCCAASAGAETHAAPVAKAGFTAEQRADIGKIAGEYLLAHPEILLQVSQKLQAQQADRLSLSMRAAAVKLQGPLTTDPDVPSLGPADARVAVIEFFDYQCVYCSRMAPVVEQVMKARPEVKYIFKDWPIFASRWETSKTAAERGLQVWKQKGAEAYMAHHNGIYGTGHDEGKLTQADIDQVSKAAGFAPSDAVTISARAVTERSDGLAQAIGLTGTPGFIIMPLSGATTENTTVLGGAVPAEQLQDAIDRASGKP